MGKNTNKRSVSETEVAGKVKEQNVPKKKKLENGTVQNGKSAQTQKVNVKAEKKAVAVVKEVSEKKKQKREALREKRKVMRKEKRHAIRSDIPLDDIKRKIEEVEKRGNLTKSAKRKLAVLRKLVKVKEGTYVPKEKEEKKAGKNAKAVAKKAPAAAEQKKVPEKVEAKSAKKEDAKKKNLLLLKKEKPEEEPEESEEEEESDEAVTEDEDASDVEEEEDVDDEEDDEEDDEDEEEEEDDDDDDEEEDEEEEKVEEKVKGKGKPAQSAKAEQPKEKVEQDGKKKRFVLFVGNLPYSTTQEEIKKHFLTKVSEVVDVRLPKRPDNSPKGFAYVELSNSADYEKALSLNHSFISGRRINVQYSGPNKKETVAKNYKLQALQKSGKFGGQKFNFQKNAGGWKGKQQGQKTRT